MDEKKQALKTHSVKYNFMMNIILRMSSLIFPLISLPYITRTLGAVGNGKVAFAVSIINYFSMLAQLGIPTYGIRVCAKCRDDKDELTKTVQEILFINMLSVVLSYVLLIICFILVPKLREEPILIAINSASILLNAIGMDWFYQALEQYQYITVKNISFKFFSVLMMFLLVKNPKDYVLYGALTVIGACGSNILNLIHSRKFLYNHLYSHYSFSQHIKPIFTFFALSMAVTVYTNMDTVMLGFMSTEEEIGFYNLATKVKLILAMIVSALGPVLLPRISYCLGHNNIAEFKRLINKSLEVVMLLSLPTSAYFFCTAPKVVLILGGAEYQPAVSCMRVLMLTIIPLALGNIACLQILAPAGLETKTVISTVWGAIINLMINALLIPRIGANGAAVGTVTTEIVVMLIQLHYARSYLHGKFECPSLMKILFSTVAATAAVLIVSRRIETFVLVEMIVTACVFFSVYLVILLMLKEKMIWEYYHLFSKRFKM